ncbi:Hypothetical protein R9X50_00046200 [Acrodontium crateriforme]|uniref:Major facilitator superfamily (MFS) profile domain-containing protein n=1 Tax=Acrodontium crateriforme TaxID=150365 RepID=A0AAQ3M0B9_9PEZI|nr:Hypothetical protein R9X50_00046200 [Acrodontium crateriforme]
MATLDEEQLAGTIRLFDGTSDGTHTSGGHITLIPTPTDSPNDPLKWSPWRKYWHTTLVLFITGLTAATSNDAGAASDGLLNDLGISYNVDNTGAGVLFIGIGYFTLLASPMPKLYGRRMQYLLCLVFSIVGAVWFARIQTAEDSIWCQLFVGASEGCAEALVQLSLNDITYQHQRGTVLGIYILATSIGTFLGPLIAGYVSIQSWRWIGWTNVIISSVTLVVFYFGLEETAFDRNAILGQQVDQGTDSAKRIENEKDYASKELAVDPPMDQEMAMDVRMERRKTYFERIALITPAPNMVGTGLRQYFQRLWQSMRVFIFPAVLFSGLQWGAQDAWLTFYLTIEENNWYDAPWNYTDQAVAIMNIPTLIGATIGCFYGGWFSDIFTQWMAKRRGGISEAEDRLWLLIPSIIINPAGLMLFGIGTDKGYSWPAPYVGLAFIGFGWGCAGDLSMAYLMDSYPEMIMEGMVGVAVFNNTLACVFTFVCSYWIDGSGIGNTFIAIGVLSFCFQCLVFPMIYWGKTWRRWTAPRYKHFLHIRDGQ